MEVDTSRRPHLKGGALPNIAVLKYHGCAGLRRKKDTNSYCSECRRPLKEQHYRTDPETMAIQKVWACLNVRCPNYLFEVGPEICKKVSTLVSLDHFLEA